LRNLTFHTTDSDQMIAFSKRSAGGDTVLVIVNLDPHAVRETTVHLNMPELGMRWDESFEVQDELTKAAFLWSEHNYVRLDSFTEPAHIFTVRRMGTTP
jgi:starch synthase (maltosyl-transferring)